jgi:hypothetical protein
MAKESLQFHLTIIVKGLSISYKTKSLKHYKRQKKTGHFTRVPKDSEF